MQEQRPDNQTNSDDRMAVASFHAAQGETLGSLSRVGKRLLAHATQLAHKNSFFFSGDPSFSDTPLPAEQQNFKPIICLLTVLPHFAVGELVRRQ